MGMRGVGEGSEMVVTVAKSELIVKLTENRAKHVAEFEEACRVWRAKMGEELLRYSRELGEYRGELEAMPFDKIKSLPQPRVHELPKPQSYARSYDRALGMLALHVKDEMTIDMPTYRQYVEDDWDWKSAAMVSNSRYLGG